MPELAEVEYFRKEWNPGMGQLITRVSGHAKARVFRDASLSNFAKHLIGQTLLASFAHGKQMLFQFSGDKAGGHNWLGVHLGMTGRLRSQSLDFKPEKHDHLLIKTKETVLVFSDPRMFGKVTFDRCEDFPEWWQTLPPDVAAPQFTLERMSAFVRRFETSPIKAVLLDQRGFPGIGNWMGDEICWRSLINPSKKCGELTEFQLEEIWQVCRDLASQAMAIIGKDWGTPPETWLFTYRWRGEGDCPRRSCGFPLNRVTLRGRTTCWCPSCQV